MTIQELIPLGPKTTMRIGGQARWYAEIMTKKDAEEAVKFAQEKGLPLIPLGGGSNTIFADGVIEALVVRIKADKVSIDGNRVTVESGKILASLLNDLAKANLDLSPLTGILGTVGGAIFGNAGQGAGGIWIDSYVENVTALVDGEWKTFSREECDFRYRESGFKAISDPSAQLRTGQRLAIRNEKIAKRLPLNAKRSVIIWETTLNVPSRPEAEIKAEIERLLKKRIETQPHIKTAGSCFKSLPDGTPAWKLIDAAGLRGKTVGGIQVSEKHANFLLNINKGSFADTLALTALIRETVPRIEGIEMRLYGEGGEIVAS